MAKPDDSQLVYPLGNEVPAIGSTLEIADGVRWLRMGLPFALDHINLWLLRDEIDARQGWTVVDCGIASKATKAAWEQIFADELGGLPVLRVLVTHMHPDHLGLAAWLCERWSLPGQPECRLWISTTDWAVGHIASGRNTDESGAAAAEFFASHGLVDEAALAKVKARGSYYATLVPEVPARYRRLMDAQVLTIGGRDWRCIAGYGHAPEHISFMCDELGLLIAGDMLLPRISTNVSVFEMEPEGNPLPLFLASLARLAGELPSDTLVLPSHGRPFRGAHWRIMQLEQHHDDRLADLLCACESGPTSAAEMLPVLFERVLDLHQTTFAMGEAIAHLHLLWLSGRLSRQRDAAGVWRFALP